MLNENLPLNHTIFSSDLNNISQLDRLKLFLQKDSYVQLSVFGICFLIFLACLIISPWSLCLLKPSWCLSIFHICCRGKPVHTMFRQCLAAHRTPLQQPPAIANETEMVPLQPNAPNHPMTESGSTHHQTMMKATMEDQD